MNNATPVMNKFAALAMVEELQKVFDNLQRSKGKSSAVNIEHKS